MDSTKRLTTAALFATLTCAATLAVRIPIPGSGGYIHPGDALVILCGIFLAPAAGVLAAGIGSGMADLLGGYLIYAPATILIKGLAAFLGGKLFHAIRQKTTRPYPALILGGSINILLVCGGYFLYETLLYGYPVAVLSLVPNAVQTLGGLILAALLYPLLRSVRKLQ